MAQEGEIVDRGDEFFPTDAEIAAKEAEKVVEPVKEPEKQVEEVKAEPEEPKKEPEKEEKGAFVPRERLNEAVKKERAKTEAAAARATELEQQLAARTTSADIEEAQKIVKDMIKQRNSHLGDGELDKASEVDSKIFELQGAIAERKAEIRAEQSKTQAVESMKYDVVVERLEEEHPEINPDADEYDEELATEIRALMRGYQQELKLSPAQALARAAKRVFGQPVKPLANTGEAKDKRKAEATERNLDAAKKQPASTKDVGLDHDKKGGGFDAKTVMNMEYAEFNKLGDDVLSRLRGDTL